MKRISKIFISFFILFHLMVMMRVHLPLDTIFFSTLYRPVDAYLSFFSIYQDWMMFAKNPSRTNTYLKAEVEFDDGQVVEFKFPHSPKLSLGEKYIRGERYRKLITEALTRDSHSYMWRDVAKFILRKVKDENFDRIPMRVHLYRYWNQIPPMNEKFLPHQTISKINQKFKFHTYEVWK